MRGPVHAPELLAVRDVAEQLDPAAEPAFRDRPLHLLEQGAVADHGEPPARVEPRDDVQQQQRVLLGVDPPDRDQLDLALPRAGKGLVERRQLLTTDEREAAREHRRAPAAVVRGDLLALGRRRHPACDQPEDALEQVRHRQRPAPARARQPGGDVLRIVLPDTQEDLLALRECDQGERDRHRVRAEDPDRVEVRQLRAEASNRARQRTKHPRQVEDAAVEGKRHEADVLLGEDIGEAPRRRVEPAEQDDLVHARREARDEPDHGDVHRDQTVVGAVRHVVEDTESHDV